MNTKPNYGNWIRQRKVYTFLGIGLLLFFFGAFFVLGYLLFADERFSQAIRRDWWIILLVGIAVMLAGMAIGMSLESFDIEQPPRTFWEFLTWGFVAAGGWCWTIFMLFIGMRYLNRDSKALRYGQAAILPFFVVHQAVIVAIAYFAVQWEATIPIKLLVVVLGGFMVSIGLYEFAIKRVGILRAMFGMKEGPPVEAQVATG